MLTTGHTMQRRLGILCRLSLSRKHIAIEGGNFMSFESCLLVYARTNNELAELFIASYVTGKILIY
jgi:hypothetical protein